MNFKKLMDKLHSSRSNLTLFEKYKETILRLLVIKYKGVVEMSLNPTFVVKQGLLIKEIKTLRRLHLERIKMFEEMKKTKNKRVLRSYVKKLEKLEFALQKAWRFEQDANFHTWWYKAPHCKCPRMDNEDNFGTGMRIISHDCILHYKPVTKKPEMKKECKICYYMTRNPKHDSYKCMVPGTCPAIGKMEKKNK